MLNQLRLWALLRRPPKTMNLNPLAYLVVLKPSFSNLAAVDDSMDFSISNPRDPVREILRGFKSFGPFKFLSRDHFRMLISGLSPSQVDQILHTLRTHDAEFAVAVFHSLRDDYGFRHSKISNFIICHIVAEKGHLRELRQILRKMVESEVYVTEVLSKLELIFRKVKVSTTPYGRVMDLSLSQARGPRFIADQIFHWKKELILPFPCLYLFLHLIEEGSCTGTQKLGREQGYRPQENEVNHSIIRCFSLLMRKQLKR